MSRCSAEGAGCEKTEEEKRAYICFATSLIAVRTRATRTEGGGGEGRDSNPRVALSTAASKPAAALANGDLSTSSTRYNTAWRSLRNIRVACRVDPHDRKEFAEVITEPH